MFCLNMLRICVELSRHDPAYEDMAVKFLDHFLDIAGAMTDMGRRVLVYGTMRTIFFMTCCACLGEKIPLRLRSMVGPDSSFLGRDYRAGGD